MPDDREQYDDLEIVDGGHQASTERTEAGVEEFRAVVENSGNDATVTVELKLRDEENVLGRHEATHHIAAGSSERFRFLVRIPPDFDQYEFAVAERTDAVDG